MSTSTKPCMFGSTGESVAASDVAASSPQVIFSAKTRLESILFSAAVKFNLHLQNVSDLLLRLRADLGETRSSERRPERDYFENSRFQQSTRHPGAVLQ